MLELSSQLITIEQMPDIKTQTGIRNSIQNFMLNTTVYVQVQLGCLCYKLCMAIFNDQDDEGIFVFCTKKISCVSPCPMFRNYHTTLQPNSLFSKCPFDIIHVEMKKMMKWSHNKNKFLLFIFGCRLFKYNYQTSPLSLGIFHSRWFSIFRLFIRSKRESAFVYIALKNTSFIHSALYTYNT